MAEAAAEAGSPEFLLSSRSSSPSPSFASECVRGGAEEKKEKNKGGKVVQISPITVTL